MSEGKEREEKGLGVGGGADNIRIKTVFKMNPGVYCIATTTTIIVDGYVSRKDSGDMYVMRCVVVCWGR